MNEKELIQSGISPELINQKNYVRAKGFLENASLFDANFFDFTAHEAETLDPQFRLFLKDFLASIVAYKLNLTGPCITPFKPPVLLRL